MLEWRSKSWPNNVGCGVTWVVSCDFWGLSGSHDAALSVNFGHDSIVTTGNPTPKSVDPRKGEIRRPCITANFRRLAEFF